ncbi:MULTISPECIES: amino acid ABC transporter permease [Rhizobium]|uniref:Inner membrane amino-acid ABC transporter permease protein yecS n=1 Tax=Rhizobium favelukesii TaxID=348824 RepID=W6RM68_9HYPH|nr:MULTISPECIES: amino acid ABC transporter permease [Rhizobium]MCA0806592.1 amino acid ABC transporter permease [Rhizobium sp. T1473]MCS0459795.1 amino acid ABC transporter permease [Rhizobium favelukesii]UFS85307.1 amino acid ABC transporter permease [Rhizobium sp. T136]CDM61325.1 Inner membrane amino-acid ABC transporter permease protein yecS [Rhizobium favelukesii]
MNEVLLNRIIDALLTGAIVTVEVSVGALAVALVIGLTLATIEHLTVNRAISFLIRSYVESLRNVPSLTFLFLLYFGLAAVGVRLSSMTAAVIGLGLIGGAVVIDIFRAGFRSVPKGQNEAAAAIGLRPLAAFRLVILPQGLRLALPPLGNYAVGLVKDTSLVAAIAAPEVMFNARQIVNETFATAWVYGAAAVLYLALTFVVGQAFILVERRLEY